jgi:hypothetical protein
MLSRSAERLFSIISASSRRSGVAGCSRLAAQWFRFRSVTDAGSVLCLALRARVGSHTRVAERYTGVTNAAFGEAAGVVCWWGQRHHL